MPEGVEVKLQLEKLDKLLNQDIDKIEIHSGRYTRHGHPKGYISLKKNLPLKIKSIHHKGKFIYLMLSNDWIIMITLGMTGRLLLKKEREKHDHIEFITEKYKLFFNDLRNFGTIEFTNKKEILLHKLDKLGFDPLQEKITTTEFYAHIGKFKNMEIAELMLNQKFVSGIGNYLRSDILYCSKINPHAMIRNLSTDILNKLLKCIYKTMENSYRKQKVKKHKFLIYRDKEAYKYKDTKGRMVWYDPKIQLLGI